MAIKHHWIEIAQYLIQRGANVNAVNKVSFGGVTVVLDPLIDSV
jgi:ankyrin repeat protein